MAQTIVGSVTVTDVFDGDALDLDGSGIAPKRLRLTRLEFGSGGEVRMDGNSFLGAVMVRCDAGLLRVQVDWPDPAVSPPVLRGTLPVDPSRNHSQTHTWEAAMMSTGINTFTLAPGNGLNAVLIQDGTQVSFINAAAGPTTATTVAVMADSQCGSRPCFIF